MLADACEIATVPQARLGAVAGLVAHALDDIVLRVTIGEAVGHEQVEHVGIGEATMIFCTHGTVLERVAHLLTIEVERHLSGLCTTEVEIDQQVVG